MRKFVFLGGKIGLKVLFLIIASKVWAYEPPKYFYCHVLVRLESLREVNSRHEKDLDRIVDEMVNSQEVVERAERNIPDYVEKHKFYQDLRGYVTDMVDCYNEKVIHHHFALLSISSSFT